MMSIRRQFVFIISYIFSLTFRASNWAIWPIPNETREWNLLSFPLLTFVLSVSVRPNKHKIEGVFVLNTWRMQANKILEQVFCARFVFETSSSKSVYTKVRWKVCGASTRTTQCNVMGDLLSNWRNFALNFGNPRYYSPLLQKVEPLESKCLKYKGASSSLQHVFSFTWSVLVTSLGPRWADLYRISWIHLNFLILS